MKKKERLVGIIMAIIMSVAMGLFFAIFTRATASAQQLESMPPAPITIITSIIEAIIVGLIVAFVIPIGKMGHGLCQKFGANPPSFKFTLINCIPFAVINAVLCSIVCSFIGVATAYGHIADPDKPPLIIMWFSRWIVTLPLSIVLGYVVAIIISPLVVKAVGLGGPPRE